MTSLRNLKTFIFLVLVALTIASCSKKDDPTPVAINTLVTGVYPLTSYRVDSAGIAGETIELPYIRNGKTFISGTMTAAAVTNSTTAITLAFHLVVEGDYDRDFPFGQFELVKDGATYNLIRNGAKFGTIDGTNLNYDGTEPDAATKIVYREIITGRRQ